MDATLDRKDAEVQRLQRCVRNVASLLALSQMRTGSETSTFAHSLTDALFEMLEPSLVYLWLDSPVDRAPIEIVHETALNTSASRLGAELRRLLGEDSRKWPRSTSGRLGGKDMSIVTIPVGGRTNLGVLVAAAARPDFPNEDEALLLRVSANHLVLALQEARLVGEVAEHARAEEALRIRELEFRLIVDSIPAPVAVTTPTGKVEGLNQSTLDYFGKTFEELRGWQASEVVHPDDLERTIAAQRVAHEMGSTYNVESRHRRADGVYRWFNVLGLPLRDAQGNILRWFHLLTDIDDRKRAEAELRRAYDSVADAQRLSKTGSFITALVGDDHNWSEEAYRIFEFDPATKISVRRVRDTVHPDDLPSFDSVIARGRSGANVDFAFRIVTARGAVKHVCGVAHVIEQVEGRPMFVGALQDMTESMVAGEALNMARSQLAHVARVTTLSALTASIAHEVNQPLSGIITNAGTCLRMLDADPPNVEGARETVRRTIRDGNRASEVITRLRALFSKKQFSLESLDLNEAAREVIALSLSELQRNRVVLQSELADDLPNVTGDRVQLQQVILNLLLNAADAVKSIDDRPRQILIQTALDETAAVRLTVRDTGIGLAPDSLTKLFDAFYTTKPDGMGIGLSVSRSIIDHHHGRLWASPNDGPGTAFSFSIPCSPADDEHSRTRGA